MVVKQEEWTQTLLKSNQKEPQLSSKSMASQTWQSLTLATSISTSTYGKVEDLDVTLDNPAGFADRSWWMIGYKCVIYEWSKLHFELFIPWGKWKWLRSDTERREYPQAQMQSDQIRTYIANNTNTKVRYWGSNVRSLSQRSKAIEISPLAPARADPRGWCKKINSKRYPHCIW